LNADLAHDQYAIYILIIGISGWFTIFGDPGIGFCTQNKISEKIANKKNYDVDILSAYILLASTSILIALITYYIKNPIALFLFGNINLDQKYNLGNIFWFSSLILTVSVASSAANKFLYSTGKGYIGNSLGAIGSFGGLLILIFGIQNSGNKIMYAVIATCAPTMIISVFLAGYQIKVSLLSYQIINRVIFIDIIKVAKGFFIFSLLGALVVQIDYLVMSQKIKPIDIVQYYNIAKLFGLIAFINQAILYAMWPDFTKKYFEKEYQYIRKALKNIAIRTSLLTLAGTILIASLSDYIGAFLLSSSSVDYRKSVILSFGLVGILRCFADPYAIFLQSINDTRPLIIFVGIQVPICIALQWELSTYFSIEGILLGLVCSFLLTVSWMLPKEVGRKLGAAC
jgi:O-antigen/teichoic acid export membrane protein